MAYYLSPLVDIKEIDLSTTIPAVATSIGVILLRNTYKGPEQKQEFVSSEDEMVRVFGKPTNNLYCYEDMMAAAGFLKYGNKLYVTRVLPSDATFAGTKASSAGFGDYDPVLTLEDFGNQDDPYSGNPDEFADLINVDDNYDMWLIATSRGAWGNNIRVSMVTKQVYDRLNSTPLSGVYAEEWYPYSNAAGTVKPEWAGLENEATYFSVMNVDSPLDTNKDFLIIVEVKEQGEDNWSIAETWNVSTNPLAVDSEGRSRFATTLINMESKYIRVNFNDIMENQDWRISTMTWEYFGQGSDGTVVSNELIGEMMAALSLYENAEEIDVNMFIDGDKPITIKQKLIEICESRKDAMCILDCLYEHVVNNRSDEVEDLTEWRKGIGRFSGINNLNENTSYASLYGNWLEVYDKYNKKYRWIPASGHVAGIYAHTDDVSDPWWAPAGLNRAILTGVRRLAWNPKLGDRDMLYKNGINPIVSFAGQGKVVWGQKTMLDKSSAFNRVNVRRLFIVLEKAISTAAKYFLFEPNDEITREQLKSMIEPFLRDVKARRGVYDFRVICDETNNTPERIDRNELWATILIKPTRVAEFIVLQFVALKTGASFEESAAQVDNFQG
jgi:hypothetical protein